MEYRSVELVETGQWSTVVSSEARLVSGVQEC